MTKKFILLTALALLLAACGATAESSYESAPMAPHEDRASTAGGEAEGAPGMSSDEAQNQIERMIVWTASVELTVKDAQKSMADAQALAHELGGYAIGSETWLQDSQLFARLTIRVPADRFESAMARLRDMAVRVDRETATSDDVTDEYVDLESRLRHLEAKEAQLTRFLEQAEDTEAVLAVYEQLSATQADIEQVKGRMAYLEKLSAMATITLNLRPEEAARPVVEAGWQPSSTLRNAARSLVDALQGLGDILIWAIVFLLPILLLLAVPVVILFLVVRRLRQRKRAAKVIEA